MHKIPEFPPPPAPEVGGKYGINVETLTGDKTLTVGTDEIYQYFDENGANRIITLSTTGASAGDRFVIRHNGQYQDTHYLEVKQGATTLDKIYVSAIKEFIFNGTNWISGSTGTGEDDGKRGNIIIGYGAYSHTDGVAIGFEADGHYDSVAIGWTALGHTSGVAIGNAARGSTQGVGIGNSAYGEQYGVAVGSQSRTNSKRYSIALGYYARCFRASETATNIDGATSYKNQVVQARWSGQTEDDTPTELMLGNFGAERFASRYKEAVAFTGLVVATDQYVTGPHHDTKAWKVEGLIRSDAGGNFTSVAITHAVIGNDAGAAAWDAVFSVSGTNLILTVTGAVDVTIKWAAFIDAVEVAW